MTDLSVLDAAGRRRSPATLPGYHAGRPPHNKGMRYPADPPMVDEIGGGHAPHVRGPSRLAVRAMIVILWRAGCATRKCSRSQSTTSTTGADRSWSDVRQPGARLRFPGGRKQQSQQPSSC